MGLGELWHPLVVLLAIAHGDIACTAWGVGVAIFSATHGQRTMRFPLPAQAASPARRAKSGKVRRLLMQTSVSLREGISPSLVDEFTQ